MLKVFCCIVVFIAGFAGLSCAQVTSGEEYNPTVDTTDKKEEKDPRKKNNIRERLVYGGNLGLWISSSSYIQVNPMLGYRLTNWMASGLGYNYTYFGNSINNISYYGPTAWLRLRPLNGLYLHTEYNHLRASYYDKTIPVWMVGGGYVSQGNVASVGLFLMYDLVQHEYSPYRGSFVPSGGILIGF